MPHKAALANAAELNAKSVELFGADQRWMAFPTTVTTQAEDANLHAQHEAYYDDEASYQRVLKTKRKYDPNDVFSANAYSIRAK